MFKKYARDVDTWTPLRPLAAAGPAPLGHLAHGVVQAQEEQGAPPPPVRVQGGQRPPGQPARPPHKMKLWPTVLMIQHVLLSAKYKT